jgi:hypothetical protein
MAALADPEENKILSCLLVRLMVFFQMKYYITMYDVTRTSYFNTNKTMSIHFISEKARRVPMLAEASSN